MTVLFRAFRAALVVSLLFGAGCAVDAGEEEEATDDVELEAKASRRFEVLTHNIGGGAENDGGPAGIRYTLSRIEATKPDVVMLEEVCFAQYEAFKQKFPSWSVLFAPMTTNEGGEKCGGTPKGQLLASPRKMTEAIRQDLGDPDGPKVFTLLCGEVPIPGTARKVLSCVTHLRAHDADAERKRQVWRIVSAVDERLRRKQPIVIAGDFNAGPGRDTLDRLYRLTRSGKPNGGAFDEADQENPNRERYAARDEVRCAATACRTGQGTMTMNGAKLDYVFFSHDRVRGQLGAAVDSSGGSGHKLYRAWAKLEL
jgi:endonuclease/exonuclease/phosphatase family metal-dependent hydrolase